MKNIINCEDMLGFICNACKYKVYHDYWINGCSHPYLYNKYRELTESRNERIENNMASNKCYKKEVKL